MSDENEPLTGKTNQIILGEDLDTLSIEDLDERVILLEQEILRLKEEKQRKISSVESANAFFKI